MSKVKLAEAFSVVKVALEEHLRGSATKARNTMNSCIVILKKEIKVYLISNTTILQVVNFENNESLEVNEIEKDLVDKLISDSTAFEGAVDLIKKSKIICEE